MRIPRMLRASLLIAAAVVLGLLTVQGTYALWNARTTSAPGTVSSASFDVRLAAAPSGQVTNMTLPSGPATISLAPTATLSPGSSVYASLAVNHNSDAGGTFDTGVTVGPAGMSPSQAGTVSSYVTVSAKNVASVQGCNSLSGYVALTGAGLTSAAVPKNTGTVFCFQVTLSSSIPPSMKGQTVNISLPITARQLCGVPSGC